MSIVAETIITHSLTCFCLIFIQAGQSGSWWQEWATEFHPARVRYVPISLQVSGHFPGFSTWKNATLSDVRAMFRRKQSLKRHGFGIGSVVCVLMLNHLIHSCCRYRWAFVPEVDVNCYGGPETALIEGEQECTPHVVKILEGIHQRYGVRSHVETIWLGNILNELK